MEKNLKNLKENLAQNLKDEEVIKSYLRADKLSMALLRSFSNKKSIYDRLYPLLEKICQILENNFPKIQDEFMDHFKK